MVFDNGDGTKDRVGMNSPAFDWHNFVLNTFDWLSGSAINSDRTKSDGKRPFNDRFGVGGWPSRGLNQSAYYFDPIAEMLPNSSDCHF